MKFTVNIFTLVRTALIATSLLLASAALAHATYFDSPVSPDGSNVVFVSERNGGDPEVFVATTSGDRLVNISNGAGRDSYPHWSPDGSKILFTSYRDGNEEVYVANRDGSGLINLSGSPEEDSNPQWSPDGQYIAFSSYRDLNSEIYTVKPDGSDLHNVSGSTATDTSAEWSSDGSRLLFSSSRDGNYEIYTVKPDGSELHNVTQSTAIDQDAHWLAGTDELVFESNRDADVKRDIYRAKYDGSSVTNISNDSADSTDPVPSPDGGSIFFKSNRDEPTKSSYYSYGYVMGSNGDGQWKVSGANRYPSNVQWSADSTALLFSASYNVYRVGRDGSGLTALATSSNVINTTTASAAARKRATSCSSLENMPGPDYYGEGDDVAVTPASSMEIAWSTAPGAIVEAVPVSTGSSDTNIYIINESGTRQSTVASESVRESLTGASYPTYAYADSYATTASQSKKARSTTDCSRTKVKLKIRRAQLVRQTPLKRGGRSRIYLKASGVCTKGTYTKKFKLSFLYKSNKKSAHGYGRKGKTFSCSSHARWSVSMKLTGSVRKIAYRYGGKVYATYAGDTAHYSVTSKTKAVKALKKRR